MVASTNGEGSSSENVKVVVRVRPLNDKELAADYRNFISVDSINGWSRYSTSIKPGKEFSQTNIGY